MASGPIAAACGGDRGAVARAPIASASAPAASSASATAAASALPAPTATITASPANVASPETEWLKSLPPRAIDAKADMLVWATVPTDNDVRVGVYRVLAVTGSTAALQDLLRIRWEKVPGALVLPVGDPIRLKPDMNVTYADWRGFVGIGRIVSTTPKVRVTFRDAYAVVREELANVAEPLTGQIAPLQWVAFPRADDALHKGLVFAVDGDTLFVRDEWSHAHVVDRAKATPLKIPSKRLKVGEAVRAYSPERGYRDGVVAKIYLPGISYAVTADGETRIYPFSDLSLP